MAVKVCLIRKETIYYNLLWKHWVNLIIQDQIWPDMPGIFLWWFSFSVRTILFINQNSTRFHWIMLLPLEWNFNIQLWPSFEVHIQICQPEIIIPIGNNPWRIANSGVYLQWVGLLCLNTSFNNSSVISWQSVLLVEKTGVLWENLQQVTDKLDHIILYQVHLTISRFQTLNVSSDRHWLQR